MLKAQPSPWHEFMRGRPGRRFQDAHARHLESGGSASGWRRWLLVGLGIVLTVAGLVLLAFPGQPEDIPERTRKPARALRDTSL